MMEDRFLFRVWDNSEKRMIVDEQDFIPLKITNKGILRLSPFNNGLYSIIDFGDRFALEQCTGLKDKNGMLIFEGDFLNFVYGMIGGGESASFIGKVFWHEKTAKFAIWDDSNRQHNCKHLILFDNLFKDNIEIIGNIHDNPETLNT